MKLHSKNEYLKSYKLYYALVDYEPYVGEKSYSVRLGTLDSEKKILSATILDDYSYGFVNTYVKSNGEIFL